ncbi:728_t:CDS:1 [Ambispora leptoticha]|uniref:728_t:CDS:1 n=1 Tax=Ambispora leptoticha TaxID=144679 RepID=A0A9N8VNN5_9GLOM|nr:728_t:CDS:1 [Ambispora leptoticha]
MPKYPQIHFQFSSPLPMVKPQYPPNLTVEDLMQNALQKLKKTGKFSKIPNAFMAYRMQLQKEFALHYSYPGMRKLSSIAANLWKEEDENVKKTYQNLTREAQTRFEKIANEAFPLQFVQFINPNEIMSSLEEDKLSIEEERNPLEILQYNDQNGDIFDTTDSTGTSVNVAGNNIESERPINTSSSIRYNETESQHMEKTVIDINILYSGDTISVNCPQSIPLDYEINNLDYYVNTSSIQVISYEEETPIPLNSVSNNKCENIRNRITQLENNIAYSSDIKFINDHSASLEDRVTNLEKCVKMLFEKKHQEQHLL